MTWLTEIMTSYALFQNTVILRRSEVAIFADIIKIITKFIKKLFKDSRIKNYVLKCNLYLYLLILENLPISGEKLLMSSKLRSGGGVSRNSYIYVRYTCAKFHPCRIYMTLSFCSLPGEQPRKCLNIVFIIFLLVSSVIHGRTLSSMITIFLE